jgi:hypothetical protein
MAGETGGEQGPAQDDGDTLSCRSRRGDAPGAQGRLATINEIRACLAKKHGTDIACPMTTGIFVWIAAHAAEESRTAGEKNITPYWRLLKTGGELNPKYPGGIPAMKTLLAAEGHKVAKKGSKFLVAEFETKLASL